MPGASSAFPYSQLGGFTSDTANFHYHQVLVGVNSEWSDITGSTAAGVADTIKRYCRGRSKVQMICRANVQVSGACGKAQLGRFQMTGSSGAKLLMKPQIWTMERAFPLEDVTGDGDTGNFDAEFLSGIGPIRGTCQGVVNAANGPDHDVVEINPLALDFDLVGSTTGTALVRNLRTVARFQTGGAFRVQFAYEYNGSYTFTDDGGEGTERFPIFMGETTTAPKGDVELDLDTGETISYSSLLYYCRLTNNATRGGEIAAELRYQIEKA